MPSPDRLAAFALAAFVLIVIPGPSVLFAISRALAYGRRAALTTVVGGALGSFTAATAVAVGIGALVQTSAVIYTVIKFAGAAYLIFLGVQAVRHRRALREAFEARAAPIGDRRTLVQGFVVGVTNPKTVVFFAAILRSSSTRPPGTLPRRWWCWARCSPRSPWRWTRCGASPRVRSGRGSAARHGGWTWSAARRASPWSGSASAWRSAAARTSRSR